MSKVSAPLALTLTGPSCSGKSVLARALVETGMFREAISTTTRAPRHGEVNGVHYNFVTKEEFAAIEKSGSLIECIEFSGESYGVTRDEFEISAAAGKHTVFVCEPHGVEMVNRFATDNQWRLLTAFLGVPKEIAVSRFMERYRQEPGDRAQAVERYAKRIVKAVTDEREWTDRYDFDLVLPHSLSEADTRAQIRMIEDHCDKAQIPPYRKLREGSSFPASLVDRLLASVQRELSGCASHPSALSAIEEYGI